MEKTKNKNLFSFAKIATVFIIFSLFGIAVFFGVNFVFLHNKINDLEEEKNDLNALVSSLEKNLKEATKNDDQTPDEEKPSQEIEENTGLGEKYIWPNELSSDFDFYIPSLKEKANFPIYYFKESELISDIKYVQYDEVGLGNFEDFEFSYFTFDQEYDGKKFNITLGIYGTGGVCDESYDLDTKIENQNIGICVYQGKTTLGMPLPLLLKNNHSDTTNLQIFVEKVYEKTELEEIMKNLVKTD